MYIYDYPFFWSNMIYISKHFVLNNHQMATFSGLENRGNAQLLAFLGNNRLMLLDIRRGLSNRTEHYRHAFSAAKLGTVRQ